MDEVYSKLVGMLPGEMRSHFMAVDERIAAAATEIRFRSGSPAAVYVGTRPYFLKGRGHRGLVTDSTAIRAAVQKLCDYSLYRRESDLADGYVTIRGGHRVGICATMNGENVIDLTNIGSASIRIAREKHGCADVIFAATWGIHPCSVLLASEPQGGKTTVLRDYIRTVCNPPYLKKTVVLDERGEIANVYRGERTLDTGITCDVLDGYPRGHALQIAIRTLSPELIVCDEMYSSEDFEGMERARFSGINILASVHARNKDELMQNKYAALSIERGIFDYIVFLDGQNRVGQLREIVKVV